MAFDNMLAIWSSHLYSTLWIVFFCHYVALNLRFADSGTKLFAYIIWPPPHHKTQTLHQWLSARWQWDSRVAGLHHSQPFWFNMCKPVRSAHETGGMNKHCTPEPWQHVGENYWTTKSRSDRKELKKKKTLIVSITKKDPADACYK